MRVSTKRPQTLYTRHAFRTSSLCTDLQKWYANAKYPLTPDPGIYSKRERTKGKYADDLSVPTTHFFHLDLQLRSPGLFLGCGKSQHLIFGHNDLE